MRWNTLVKAGMSFGIAAILMAPSTVYSDVRAKLDGFQEGPSVSTDATGSFRAKLRRGADEIAYKLSYSGIETFVRFAHIHFAERHVNGAIVVWLCDNTGNAPIVVQPCPQGGGTVEAVITPDSVSGAPSQGLDVGEFDGLIDAINAMATYVNVHSDAFPSGEIRGQVRGKLRGRGRDNDDQDEDDDD